MSLAYKKTKDSALDRNERFLLLSRKLSEMAAQEDLNITPFEDPKLVYFSRLESKDQSHVLEQLETLVFICQQIQERGEKIRSVKSLTWAFLKHFQCVGPSDLLNHMEDTDFVDAYGLSHRMLFAGLTFFEVFSYSLEEFFCRPWVELFRRLDQTVHDQLLQLSHDMVNGKYNNIVSTKYIPTHQAQEAQSEKAITVNVEPQCFAPLFNNGQIIGYLCVNRGTLSV